MNLQRFAGAIALVLAISACSGSEESPETGAVEATLAPQTTAVIETSPEVAPTTSQATASDIPSPVVTSTIPQSLAFSGIADVGSLFEVDGGTASSESPGGESTGIVADSTLVRVVQATGREGQLFVLIIDTADLEGTPIGWVSAGSLRNTNQSVILDDPATFGELRRVSGSIAGVDVLTEVAGNRVARVLAGGEVAIHGGSTALSSDGGVWLDVLEPQTLARVGWVPDQLFVPVRSTFAHDQDFGTVATSPEVGVNYGAPLVAPQISLSGCNAVQVEVQNDSALGLAFVVGLDVPMGQAVRGEEIWVSSQGATFYASPGDTITLTLAAEATNLWHFAGLDGQFRAQANRSSNGTLLDSPAAATSFEVIQVNAGACVTAPPDAPATSDEPVEDDQLDDGFDQQEFDDLEQEINELLNEPVQDEVPAEESQQVEPVDEQPLPDEGLAGQSVQDELDQQ